jgi:hypothetical protein
MSKNDYMKGDQMDSDDEDAAATTSFEIDSGCSRNDFYCVVNGDSMQTSATFSRHMRWIVMAALIMVLALFIFILKLQKQEEERIEDIPSNSMTTEAQKTANLLDLINTPMIRNGGNRTLVQGPT